MDRAVSGQRRRLLHVVPSWRKATPGRAALATLVVVLAILGATRAFALPTLRLVTNNNDSGLGSLDLHRSESEWSILSEPLNSTRSLHIRRYCVSLLATPLIVRGDSFDAEGR
jgi:hypothetical protein